MKITIQHEYFNQLKESGHTVPRYKASGDTVTLKVGGIYLVRSSDKNNFEMIRAKCTQNCPCNLTKY